MKVLDVVLQNPSTNSELWGIAVATIVVAAFVFGRVSDKLDLPNVGLINSALLTLGGFGLIVVAISLCEIYAPDLKKQYGELVLYGGISAIVSLALIVPMVNSYIQGKYLGTLGAWAIAMVSAILTISIAQAVLGSVKDGERMLNRGREHNEATKKMIDGK